MKRTSSIMSITTSLHRDSPFPRSPPHHVPLPVEVARHMGADIVIAVNVAFTPEEMPLRNPMDMAWQTVQIMSNTIILAQRAGADVLVESDLKGVSDRRAFDRARVIERGEHAARAARAALPVIRAKLAARAR